MNLFSLNDQVILVTGSSRGLGWEMAKAMAEAGATVILNGRDRELLSKRQTELEKAGLKSAIQAFDAANENEVLNGVQSIAEKHGQLDGLINNAGIQHRKPLQDFELSDYDRLMDVNLRGSFLLAREASKLMLEKSSGSIVNIASIYGIVGPDQRLYDGSEYLGHQISTPAAYSASKAGLLGLTRHLATVWGPRGVRVNAVTPGGIESGQNDRFQKSYGAKVPLGRMAAVSEIANAVLFLVSEQSQYLNGHNLVVDGGFSAW
ncbi:MAG: SDR family oxidoreductase [Proteobacteria bacterium]|nr:SDR family oxidoreductase [Pseudomonadota bacterium]